MTFRAFDDSLTFTRPRNNLISGPTYPGYLWTVNFSAQTPGIATDLFGFVLERSSSATVQTSATTMLSSGIGSDVARIGYNGSSRGLVLEERRTNVVSHSTEIIQSIGNWQASTNTTVHLNSASAPDSSQRADRQIITTNGFSAYYNNTTNVSMSFSTWGRATTAGVNAIWVPAVEPTAGPAGASVLYLSGISTDWQRRSITHLGRYALVCDARNVYPGTTAGNRDILVCFAQVELNARFSTEHIITSGTSGSRAGERLYRPNGGDCVSNGRLALNFNLYPKAQRSFYSSSMRLWSDAGNTGSFIEINNVNGVITCSYDGTRNFSNAINWSAEDNLNLTVKMGAAVPTLIDYSINGSSSISLPITGAALNDISVTGSSEFLCSGTGSQFSSWISSINALTFLPENTGSNQIRYPYDHLRQGVEMNSAKFLYVGTQPKLWAGSNNFNDVDIMTDVVDHGTNIVTYGQSLGTIDFDNDAKFLDTPKFNPVAYVSLGNAYPSDAIIDDSLPEEREAIIEPFTIPPRLPTTEIGVYAHKVCAELEDGNNFLSKFKSSSRIQQFIEIKAPPTSDAFSDTNLENFSGIIMDRFIPISKRTLNPFDDSSLEEIANSVQTNDSSFTYKLIAMDVNNDDDLRSIGYKSATAGWSSPDSVQGTDSLSFSGWLKGY